MKLKMKPFGLLESVVAIMVVVTIVVAFIDSDAQKKEAGSTFTQCLAKSGAIMYSAWWCPSCFAQLKAIAPSLTREEMKNTEKLVREFPFVKECAEPESGKFTMGCPSDLKGIPAWEFSDGNRLIGTQDLVTLAQKTGCAVSMQKN